MHQYTCILPLSVPSIRTTGTLGRKWDIPIYMYHIHACYQCISRSFVALGHLDGNGRYLCTNIHACYHCLTCPFVPLGHLDGNGTYLCTNIHACYHCLSRPFVSLGHLDRNGMYQYTCMLPLSVPSIRTIGTLGRKWDVPMYQYTCMLPLSVPSVRTTGTLGRKWDVPIYMHVTTVCPVHLYHWDTWMEMGCTYIQIYTLPLSVPSIRTSWTEMRYNYMYYYTNNIHVMEMGCTNIHVYHHSVLSICSTEALIRYCISL